MASWLDPPTDRRTASERIRAARLAQLVAHYEQYGWPLELVQLLDAHPLISLSDALAGFTIPQEEVA